MNDDKKESKQGMSVKERKEQFWKKCEGNERGLYLLHTGNGKGKTSAAMNMVYRHLIHGFPVAVVQFVKCADEYPDGDRAMLTRLGELGFPITIQTLGTGFSWNSTDQDADRKAAEHALANAAGFIKDDHTKLVLMDELHIAIKRGLIETGSALKIICNRPDYQHVITTGRHAPEALIDAADLVTEMKLVKHPMTQKIPAQKGIEY